MKPYHWHQTVEQTSTRNREAGSWNPASFCAPLPEEEQAPESCRETFQHCTSGGSQLWQGSVSMATEGLTLPLYSEYAEGSDMRNF